MRAELRTLTKENAAGVGAHLVMVARLIDTDIDAARAHADAAVRRAGRVPAVREARGLVAYHEGDWAVALAEFRTARRLSGQHHLLPYLVDCERALGRPDKALDLASAPEARTLTAAEQIELLIVRSGIRRDLGQHEAALAELEGRHLVPGRSESWAPRLYYAYADALLELGRTEEAHRWFVAAGEVDSDGQTDAWERVDELDGTVVVDLGDDDDDAADDRADAADDGVEPRPASEPSGQTPDEPESAADDAPTPRGDDVSPEAETEQDVDARPFEEGPKR